MTAKKLIAWCKVNKINVLLFMFGVFVLFSAPTDPDFGWHLKYGEYLFTHGRLLRENLFSYTFANYNWANSYWLSEGIFYFFTFVFGDVYGPVVLSLTLSAIGSSALLYILSKQQIQDSTKTVVFALLILVLSIFEVSVRPIFFSSIFFLILIHILLHKESYIKFLPLLFLIWANMHADFVLGLFVFGIFVFFKLVDFKTKKLKYDSSLIFLALSILVTLVNPYFFHLQLTLLKEAQPLQFSHVNEWKGLKFHDPLLYAAYSALMVVVLLFSGRYCRKKYNLWYLLVLLFFTLLSFFAVYFLRVVYVLGIFLICTCFDDLWFPILKKMNYFTIQQLLRIQLAIKIVAVMIVFVSVALFLWKLHKAANIALWSGERFPYDAVSYIRENNLSGNMFNEYNWGGYLIWQLPEKRTFIDGRMPSWNQDGNSVFRDYTTIMADIGANQELFDEYVNSYDIRIALIKNRPEFVSHLVDNGWTISLFGENFYLLTR